jgi:hypothetical protein
MNVKVLRREAGADPLGIIEKDSAPRMALQNTDSLKNFCVVVGTLNMRSTLLTKFQVSSAAILTIPP